MINSNLIAYDLHGTTDDVGCVENPYADFVPFIAWSSRWFITGNSREIRIFDSADGTLKLYKNSSVEDIRIFAIRGK